RWKTFTLQDGIGGSQATFLYEAHGGALWLGFEGSTYDAGASRFDGMEWRTYPVTTPQDLVDPDAIRAIVEDPAGSLWFGTGDGVSRFDGSAWQTFTTFDGLAYRIVDAACVDRAGNLWICTPAGATRYDGHTWRNYSLAEMTLQTAPNGIAEDRAGNLWFSAPFGGVRRFDGSTWRAYGPPDGLADYQLNGVFA